MAEAAELGAGEPAPVLEGPPEPPTDAPLVLEGVGEALDPLEVPLLVLLPILKFAQAILVLFA
jgi:hypothetical protein